MAMSFDREQISFKNGTNARIYCVKDAQHGHVSKYPSVTTILNLYNEYESWQERKANAKEILLYAQTTGILGHWRVQNELADKWDIMPVDLELSAEQQKAYGLWNSQFPYDDKEMGIELAMEKIMDMYEQWYDKYHPIHPIHPHTKQPLNIYPFEIYVYSKKFGYAGSLDIMANILFKNISHNCLIDIKTNTTSKLAYKLQCTAYKIAFEENYPQIPIDEIRILHLPKNAVTWNYTFRKWRKPIEYYKPMWLRNLGHFYLQYGDEYPLSLIKEQVLSNIEKEGIDITDQVLTQEELDQEVMENE